MDRTSPSRHYTVSSLNLGEQERLRFVLDHFSKNKAYASLPKEQQTVEVLEKFKQRYRWYRESWRTLPEESIAARAEDRDSGPLSYPPMCVDIEVAAICDLACPFCYRQHIATPDGLIKKELFFRIIDQCVELGVPSIKLNWRGEALLHPALPELIDYAKTQGILEVLLNSNAVALTEGKAEALIEAGLDILIYSFDGGSAATYNKMRPGRFQANSFEQVYGNITTFAKVRQRLGKVFPRTRIQMIITEETAGEVDDFYRLFNGVVDDVSTKAYSERGGGLAGASPEVVKAVQDHFTDKGETNFVVDPAAIWLSSDKTIRYAKGRLPCQQIFQRLVVTYDGRVHMCCYDWAGVHTIGFVDQRAYASGDKDLAMVLEKAKAGQQGFPVLTELEIPVRLQEPEHRVTTLKEIWNSEQLLQIREKHCAGNQHKVIPCHKCHFRDTYTWETVELCS